MSKASTQTIKDLLHLNPKISSVFCYLEYKSSSENSFKFYELKIVPTSTPNKMQLVARWGRIGTSGQTKVYASGPHSLCSMEAENLRSAKVKKGYKSVS